MTVFTGHTGNAGHFLQPTASAMGHRTTPFSQGSRQLAYALSRAEAKRAHALTHVIARSSRRGTRRFVIATTEGGAVRLKAP